ncbi:MAG: FtsQ-type POTRA domain-containing protein [Oscillospiraceae bacterium]|nr:FtsQ-type POTRA domain-containing protein [Oscillospiraceae bacterium]
MAGRKKHNRRRRRGSFAPLYKLLCLALIMGAVAAAMAVFFKAEKIEVSGNSRYTAQQVVDVCGVEQGDNLFFMNKYEVAGRISQALPYVESVSINRKLPESLRIRVTECVCDVALEQAGGVWLLCQTGKVVDFVEVKPEGSAVVTGVTLAEPAVGGSLAAAEGSEAALAELRALLDHLRAKGMLADVQEIHLEREDCVSFRYLDRLNVEIPWESDLDYKLDFLAAVVAKLEDYETGTLKMMVDGEARLLNE